ncbi:MAG: DUF262 domain-containing protein [Lachnospiraceae bacterium]|nr:DUF262 domain-containing protein [Lachnospiraceae bacterium]
MKTVTLDALVPREDFDIISTAGSSQNTRNKTTLSIEDLKYDSFFFSALRKPIFQRETNEWEPIKICAMIESFVKGELVPAIILWRNKSGYIFVIDGAHRLSSLGAWINDDYGDGAISNEYYENYISQEQKEIAERTRELVNQRIGSFKHILKVSRNPQLATTEFQVEIAKNLGALALQVQWVDGDANNAEESFLRINQSATKISDAELELIQERNRAFAIAARAIVRAGKGYQYWSSFSEKKQQEVIALSKSIHMLLFGNGISNVDDINSYSIGGYQSSTLTLDVVTQTVKICNGIMKIENAAIGDEKEVVRCLKNTEKILLYINSKEPYSLGIHPFIYFYSDLGKHKIGSYYGFIMFIKELIEKNRIKDFISVRGTFEQVIYQYNFLVQQIIRRWRQSKKAYVHIKEYFFAIMDILLENKEIEAEQVIEKVRNNGEFNYLQIEILDNEEATLKGNYSRGKRQQIKLRALVENLSKCPICNGYMDTKSVSVDHIIRKQDGGTNAFENGQITHLYCNTTYKN